MAKIKEITKSINIKFKTFDFSSADIFMSVKAELDENDDFDEVSEHLTEKLSALAFEDKAVWDEVHPQLYNKPKCIK